MATGIIAEFNPFHNGHKFFLDAAGDDNGIVAVMSGAFVQRGEPAVTDKLTRACAALSGGADLVLELPVVYSLATAQQFAAGAVATLLATGVVDTLAFGSECGDAARLERAARLLLDEPPEVSARLRECLQTGMSFPAARQKAFEGVIEAELLRSPNDILAIEYIRAATELGAPLRYVAVSRHGADHDGSAAHSGVAPASLLREILRCGGDISDYSPMGKFDVYDDKALDTAIIANIRLRGAAFLSDIADVTEGLENRIYKAALLSSTLDDLCRRVKSKRYPLSRLRRIMWASFLGISKDMTSLKPQYLRVLGMTARGRALLRRMRDTATLPVVIKPADYRGSRIFDLNRRADDTFALCSPTDKRAADLRYSPAVV